MRLLVRLTMTNDFSLYSPDETCTKSIGLSLNSNWKRSDMDVKEKKNSAESATNGYKKEG